MSELVEIAILAYRSGRYRDAIELLLQVTTDNANNWMAVLYLSMAYEKAGRASDAHRLLKRISVQCPDEHLRVKATATMPILEAELRRRFNREPIGSNKNSDTNQNEDSVILLG